ncbi:hypothetical protein N0V82_010003 [Gnomoniopsis sp. IMI 355080]|nr:hypothetical protein N0V82_010003 [Gnomoniopsis sp. IMI 355080]
MDEHILLQESTRDLEEGLERLKNPRSSSQLVKRDDERRIIQELRRLLKIDLQLLMNSKSLGEVRSTGFKLSNVRFKVGDKNLQRCVQDIQAVTEYFVGLYDKGLTSTIANGQPVHRVRENRDQLDSIPSIREILHGYFEREKVSYIDIKPGGQYRAGHMVYDCGSKTYATSLTAYIGHTADPNDLCKKNDICEESDAAQAITMHWGYHKTGQAKYDFALVKLHRGFRNVVPIQFEDAPAFEHHPVYKIVGYPGDMPYGSGRSIRGSVMHQVQGKGLYYDALEDTHTLRYLLDTKSGKSDPVIDTSWSELD